MASAAAAKKWPRLSQCCGGAVLETLAAEQPHVTLREPTLSRRSVCPGFLVGVLLCCQPAQLRVDDKSTVPPRHAGVALLHLRQNLSHVVHQLESAMTGTSHCSLSCSPTP